MRRIPLLCLVGLFALPTAVAVAQTADTLSEVVVSAQRRSERLQDVPISVAVLSPSDLQAAGAVDTTSLSSSIPGLTTNTNASSFLPRIRGIGTSALATSNENPVALYVDDVYYGSQLMSIINMDDVTQVAVLKGPQGTLFGRNATGGLIQLSTRDPDKEFGGELRTDLDSYLTSRNYLYLTGGLADSVRANLSASYTTQGNGWGENTVTGRDTYKIYRDLSLRSKWIFQPGADTAIRVSLDYSDRLNSLGPQSIPAPGTTLNVPFTPLPDIHDVSTQLDNRNAGQFGGASVKLDHLFDFARFTSISSYRHYNYKTQFDLSLSPVPMQYVFYRSKGREISQEFQLASRDENSSKLSWITGLYYYSTHDLNPPSSSLQNFIPQTAPFLEEDFGNWTDNTTKSAAGYAQASFLVLADTHLTTGIRYTSEDRTQLGVATGTFVQPPNTDFFNLFFGPGAAACPPPSTVMPVTCTFTFFASSSEAKRSFDSLTWRLGLDHKFAPDVLGYVSYNRGFKSGGFNGFNPANPPYSPEKVDSYEVGLKSEFRDGRLRLNFAGFYNDYSNIQVQTFATGSPVIFNAAAAKTYGLDVDFEAALGGGLHLSGGFEWLQSKFTDFSNADYYVYRVNPFSGFPEYDLVELSAKGNRLPYAPQFSGNLGLSYSTKSSVGTFDFDLRNAYNSGYYGEANNQVRQPAFNLLSLNVSWTPPDSRLNISVYARNLLDEEVATSLYGYDYRGLAAQYGNPPRTFGGRFVYTF